MIPLFQMSFKKKSDWKIEDDEALSSDFVQQNVSRRKRFSKYLSQLHFQSKVIKFSDDFIFK